MLWGRFVAYVDMNYITLITPSENTGSFIVENILILSGCSSKLNDYDIGIIDFPDVFNPSVNFIGYMRYSFNIFTVIFKTSFFFNNNMVNLTHCDKICF